MVKSDMHLRPTLTFLGASLCIYDIPWLRANNIL